MQPSAIPPRAPTSGPDTGNSVENICNLLIRSRLLQGADVQLLHRRWRLEARETANDIDRFTKWLVTNQYVTEFQAQAVARGHADHFFLGQYKLLDRIGKGRMAGVYKALHNIGHIVAVKILPPSKARDPQVLGRFQREAKMAVRLKHVNVVRAFHMGGAGGLYYLVMEYLEGETLDEVLKRRGKLLVAEGVRLISQALLGLQHIHEQGLIHRDLKPANLMMVPAPAPGAPDNTLTAVVKILDIGLGRALFDENAPADMDDLQLTTEGAVLGTPDYLAPEQARDAHKVDIRADIYSLGCVLYHVLSGKVPFPDKSALQQIVRHTTEPLRPIREIEPAVPDGVWQIINRMMAKLPDQRYALPAQAAQALQPFLPREAVVAAEAGPQMQSYLQWVDTVGLKDGVLKESDPLGKTPPPKQAPGAESTPIAAVAPTLVPEPEPPNRNRDYFLISVGILVGIVITFAVEAIAWLLLRRH